MSNLLKEVLPSRTPWEEQIEPSPRQAAGNVLPVAAVLRSTVRIKNRFSVRSLTPSQAARNALAIAVQIFHTSLEKHLLTVKKKARTIVQTVATMPELTIHPHPLPA